MVKTIMVDDISSIGENYYSLLYKKKITKEFPFECKEKRQERSFSRYHFDENDLKIISKLEPKLKPFDQNEDLTKKEYIYHMKITIYKLIEYGKFNDLIGNLYSVPKEDFQIVWAGKKPPKFKI